MKQAIGRLLCLAVAAIFLCVPAFAQVTTASLAGRVTDNAGEAIAGAVVIAVHVPSGTQYNSVTNDQGRYSISGMRAGGPYSVEFTILGYQGLTITDVTLQLADTYVLDAALNEDAEMLSEAIVVAAGASKFTSEKTGAVTNISNREITSLPSATRAITDVARLSPYGGNGMSFAGGDGRTSNFTVDGSNFNNNFGLSEGLPGGGNPISIDAIEEVQVVISPFDVRQTNFISGGMNAITKSGTNTFKGSAYVYHRNENMRGNTVAGDELGARDRERTTTYGMTLGGPIIKDKLFFFVNFEYEVSPTVVNRWRPSEDGVADPDLYISRTTIEDMQKVSDFLKEKYGYDTGSYTDFPADESNIKALARIDWNINENHNLSVRYNYTLNRGWNSTNGSSSNCTQRATQSRLSQYSMAFANSMYSMDNLVNTVSVDLNSRFTDKLSNQFLFTFSQLDDVRGTNSEKFPFIDILDGYSVENGTLTQSFVPYMAAGYELFTWNNGVHNRVATLKDDITYRTGNHEITAGISYQYQMADNSYMRNGTGYYRYRSLDDFLNGAAPETVALTYGYDGEESPAARVRFSQAGIYAQDQWKPSERFTLTAGVRLDAMIFNNKDVMTNNAILELDYGGRTIDTGKWPGTKIQFSPRIGFSWDVLGNRRLTLRGGTGMFTGRLPLVFFTNMPTNSGMVQNVAALSSSYSSGGVLNNNATQDLLQQFAGDMLTNTSDILNKLHELDPERYPLTITPEDGVLPSAVQAVDPSFKMPKVWKTTLALDYAFPTSFPMSLTGEFIYNKTINGVMLSDWDIKDNAGWATFNGADNRYIYPSNYQYTGTHAYVLTNTNKGYGYTASATFRIRPVENLNISASYTHTVSKEITGMPGSNAESAFTYTPTVNGPNFATLHNSEYVTPDRFIASLTYTHKSNDFSIFYEAWRGGYNYTYMYANDVNGDNYSYDVIYIPRDASEIRFDTQDDADRYWAYANNDKYLSSHKGQYAEAYSVYSPWVHRVDLRYTHDFKIKTGKSTNTLQLAVDMKNVLNIFNSSWGVSKYMNPDLNSGRILSLERIDADGVPVYSTSAGVQPGMDTWTYYHGVGQCWYLQVGIKYMFN